MNIFIAAESSAVVHRWDAYKRDLTIKLTTQFPVVIQRAFAIDDFHPATSSHQKLPASNSSGRKEKPRIADAFPPGMQSLTL